MSANFPFDYTSGNPDNLTGGHDAAMQDIQGPFYDLRGYLNARIAAIPAVVTVLPASPTDGQEIYYTADATAGLKWHFRYNAAAGGPYKWEGVGSGGPLRKTGVDALTTGTGGSYSNQLGDGANAVSIVAPLSGDYWVEVAADSYHTVDSALVNAGVAADKNSGGVVSTNAPAGPVRVGHCHGTGGSIAPLFAAGPLLAVTAGQYIALMALYTARQMHYQNRVISARPIRVG